MKQTKKLRGFLLCEWLWTGLLLVTFYWQPCFWWLVLCLQMGLLFYAALVLARPLMRFEEKLQKAAAKECSEEELKKLAAEVPGMKPVVMLAERYASLCTRENSAQIFDKQTELTALQSQINPHFLYNTLETIRGQALIDDNEEIARMVEALAAFFRYSISRKGSLVTLRDELANINNYMLIQRYRFNNRFSLEIILDEENESAYDFRIPRLIIQPVVENAIFHGLEEKLEGGKVMIEIIVTEENLMITISDNGKGMGSEELKSLNKRIRSASMRLEDGGDRSQRNTGIALPNIHKRIQLLFGEDYGVNVYSTLNQGTDVEITIPARMERGEGGRT